MKKNPPEHFCDAKLRPGECPTCKSQPRPFVIVESWAGSQQVHVEILGRTPKRLRIRFLENCARGKRGDVRLVAPDVVRQPVRRTTTTGPASTMTDEALTAELDALGEEFKSFLSEECGGGSPGEWLVERMSELETEQRYRAEGKR